MTPENINQAVESVTKSDRPFMVLFVIVLFVAIYLSFRILKYFEKTSVDYQDQIKNINANHEKAMKVMSNEHKKDRDAAYKNFAIEQQRSHQREQQLFRNLEENTKQIGEIADTLKEIKFDFSNLENKVEVLSDEIVKIKTQVIKNEDHD